MKNKVLIIDGMGNVKTIENTTVVPRVGDHIDMGYTPAPVVKTVLWYPEDEDFVDVNVLAVVTVG